LKTERDTDKVTVPSVEDRYKERLTHNDKTRVSQKEPSAFAKTLPQARTSKHKLEQILKKSTSINRQTPPAYD
jgi:non-homologous end joining protein Ku